MHTDKRGGLTLHKHTDSTTGTQDDALCVSLAHECPSAAPLWRFCCLAGRKASDSFSGFRLSGAQYADWLPQPAFTSSDMLTTSAAGRERLHAFSVWKKNLHKKKNRVEWEQRVVRGQGSQPDNASSPRRHAPLEVKQRGLCSDLLGTNVNPKSLGH